MKPQEIAWEYGMRDLEIAKVLLLNFSVEDFLATV